MAKPATKKPGRPALPPEQAPMGNIGVSYESQKVADVQAEAAGGVMKTHNA